MLIENFILGYFYIFIVDIFKFDLLRIGFFLGDWWLEVYGECGGLNVIVYIFYCYCLWYDWNISVGFLYFRKYWLGWIDWKNYG